MVQKKPRKNLTIRRNIKFTLRIFFCKNFFIIFGSILKAILWVHFGGHNFFEFLLFPCFENIPLLHYYTSIDKIVKMFKYLQTKLYTRC